MTPIGVYRAFLAIKKHFTDDAYDVLKSNGRFKAYPSAFEKRKDKYQFEKMSKTMTDDEIVWFFVSNITRKNDYYSPLDDKSEERYKDWIAYTQSLSYNFEGEIKQLFYDAQDSQLCYNDVFVADVGQHPPVLTALMGKTISIETFVILDRLNSFTDKIAIDVVTESILRTARKYSPFLKVDLESYGSIANRVRELVFD